MAPPEEAAPKGPRMITATPQARQTSTWQRELACAISDPRELLAALGLPDFLLEGALAARESFPLRVPRGFVRRMRRGDPGDPLLRQVLPLAAELASVPGYVADPLLEAAARQAPGLLRKYAGRALLVTTGACAIHCRYCFRREFPYEEQSGDLGRWREALQHLAADPSIRELILSGGDPLSLGDARLAQLTGELARIPHLETLRIHTRQPVVLPERVDAGLLAWMRALPWRVVVVLHVNHPNEIDAQVASAFAALRDTGATLLNQSVLLAGVNDDLATMKALVHGLLKIRIRPYYIYQADPVVGASHLRTSVWKGMEIMEGLRGHTTGMAVPTFVVDLPGGGGKIPLAPNYLVSASPDRLVLRNFEGAMFSYPDGGRSIASQNIPARSVSDLVSRRSLQIIPEGHPHYARRAARANDDGE